MSAMRLDSLVVGNSGDGKTYYSCGHPKCYYLLAEPGSESVWESVPQLNKNIVKCRDIRPQSKEELKEVFSKTREYIKEAKEMHSKGEIETLVLDNATYFSDNRWHYEKVFNTQFSKNGDEDKRSEYGNLGDWLYNFFLMELCTFKGNLVVTCHQKLESDEDMDKKADKSSPIVPLIPGGFRNKIEGLFSLVIYLNKKLDSQTKKMVYTGQVERGNQRNGKNRFGLNPMITGISYDIIQKAIAERLAK